MKFTPLHHLFLLLSFELNGNSCSRLWNFSIINHQLASLNNSGCCDWRNIKFLCRQSFLCPKQDCTSTNALGELPLKHFFEQTFLRVQNFIFCQIILGRRFHFHLNVGSKQIFHFFKSRVFKCSIKAHSCRTSCVDCLLVFSQTLHPNQILNKSLA